MVIIYKDEVHIFHAYVAIKCVFYSIKNTIYSM